MSMRENPFYYQGVLLTPEDYDPDQLLSFLLKQYEVELGDTAGDALEDGILNAELQDALTEAFDLDAHGFQFLEEYVEELLSANPEVYEQLETVLNQHDGLSYHRLSDITGDFCYSYEPRNEVISDGHMLAFNTPMAWGPFDGRFPGSLAEAIDWLNMAGKPIFRDEIDWEHRLGELYGTEFG